MPLFLLNETPEFPDPELAMEDGLLAIGGDLSVERLLNAYQNGIYPWYDESPILWWSPDPRMILFPDKFKVSKSLWQVINRKQFDIRIDENFEAVIRNCAEVNRFGQKGTWLTAEMQQAYIELHQTGYAHSFEAYYHGELAGGLYGVSLGRMFFGESMFYTIRDASKATLFYLVQKANELNLLAIDAQQDTPHLRSLGATPLPRKQFLDLLKQSLSYPTLIGKWHL